MDRRSPYLVREQQDDREKPNRQLHLCPLRSPPGAVIDDPQHHDAAVVYWRTIHHIGSSLSSTDWQQKEHRKFTPSLSLLLSNLQKYRGDLPIDQCVTPHPLANSGYLMFRPTTILYCHMSHNHPWLLHWTTHIWSLDLLFSAPAGPATTRPLPFCNSHCQTKSEALIQFLRGRSSASYESVFNSESSKGISVRSDFVELEYL